MVRRARPDPAEAPGLTVEVDVWIVRAAVGAAISALAGGLVGLFARVRRNEQRLAAITAESAEAARTAASRAADGIGVRVDHIERRIAELPAAREIATVQRTVAELSGDVKAVRASVDGVEKMVSGVSSQVQTITRELLGQGQAR